MSSFQSCCVRQYKAVFSPVCEKINRAGRKILWWTCSKVRVEKAIRVRWKMANLCESDELPAPVLLRSLELVHVACSQRLVHAYVFLNKSKLVFWHRSKFCSGTDQNFVLAQIKMLFWHRSKWKGKLLLAPVGSLPPREIFFSSTLCRNCWLNLTRKCLFSSMSKYWHWIDAVQQINGHRAGSGVKWCRNTFSGKLYHQPRLSLCSKGSRFTMLFNSFPRAIQPNFHHDIHK